MNSSATTLPDWLRRSAENRPDHLAVQWRDVQWSFVELERQADVLARQLAQLAIHHGDRVALLAVNGLAYIAFVHALTRLGVVLVPLNTRLSIAELHWQIHDAHVTTLVSDEHFTGIAQELAGQLSEVAQLTLTTTPTPSRPTTSDSAEVQLTRKDEDIPALSLSEYTPSTEIDLGATQAIMYTSGTTGHPKGVIITYGMQWWNAVGSVLNLGHSPADRWLACMPLFHIGGLSILMRSVINGISVIIQEKFDPIATNEAILKDGVTIISVVAVMLQRMLASLDSKGEAYPSTLRCVLLGGGPAPRPLLEDCARRGIAVAQTYGLTESCSQAVTLSPADALRKLGSAGRPLLPVQVRIVRDEENTGVRQDVQVNEAGIILLKGPIITPGYAGRPRETAATIQDGWLATGDIGYRDAEGYLYILDRRSDLIISGGENVYPAEIEAVLLAYPTVEEAGVCGQPDPRWGEVPIAFVRLRPGSIEDTAPLFAHVASRLARYKQPRAIHFVDQLPRNASGKLLRRELPTFLKER